MSRNRVKDSQSLHWMGVIKWILIAGLLSGLGLSYMLCKNQNLHLAEETHRLQLQYDAIKNRNNVLALDLAGMKNQDELERQLKRMHSSLVSWGDPHANWVRLDQSTRARLVRINTLPNPNLNVGFPQTVDASSAPAGN